MSTDDSDKTRVMDDKTAAAARQPGDIHVCPVCGHENSLEALQRREYRCGGCKLELAHLDYAPNGSLRGIFGWLRSVGDIILDRYQIKSVLGKGGFGAAYLVDDLRLSGKRRALKEVPEPMFDEYETALLSKLDHPAIPDIIDRRVVDGMVYQVLKFGGSRTLGSERKHYPDKRIPQEKLFPWMRQLCEVLIYLHSQTPPIIHRDLKPDNILLNEDERIMLIDFGIAKEAAADGRTRTMAMAATVGFSPPEQVMGTGTDERADIYALGATFYALLTGQNPTPAHERIAGKEIVPPSELVPDVPPEVEDAIMQSLSLNMHQRQQSVREFAMALSGFELPEYSRPIATGEVAQQTQVLSRATEGRFSKPTGLKLPTTHVTAAKSQPASARLGQPSAQGKPILVLAAIAVILAGLATAAYYFIFKSRGEVSPPTATAPQQPTTAPTQPAATPAQPVSPPTAPIATQPIQPQAPLKAQPQIQPQTPPAQPFAQPQAPAGGSAQEMLKARVAEPEPEPITPKVAEPTQPKPKPRPVARPRPAEPVEKSRPKDSGGSTPSWVIIPGGARKTE